MFFSASVERVLTTAYREATARRHTHVTLEHLLYVLAHDPEGERILAACGGDVAALRRSLAEFLDRSVEGFPPAIEGEPEQTVAFRRVLQTAVLHVQSGGRDEVRAGDLFAALLQQPRTHAARLLASQGITRLDVLNYISHGITKVPVGPARGRRGRRGRASRFPPTPWTSRSRRAPACSIPSSGGLRSCRGRSRSSAAVARTTRCSSARRGSARRRWPKDWRRGSSGRESRCRSRSRAPRSSPSTPPPCWPGRATAAISRSA